MKYLLDTHAAIWLLEGNAKLGKKAKRLLSGETQESAGISDITLLEIAMLERRGVIRLLPDARHGLEAFARCLTVLPIEGRIATDAVNLELPQRDPFDRVIVATARAHDLILVTKDQSIVDAKLVPTVW